MLSSSLRSATCGRVGTQSSVISSTSWFDSRFRNWHDRKVRPQQTATDATVAVPNRRQNEKLTVGNDGQTNARSRSGRGRGSPPVGLVAVYKLREGRRSPEPHTLCVLGSSPSFATLAVVYRCAFCAVNAEESGSIPTSQTLV